MQIESLDSAMRNITFGDRFGGLKVHFFTHIKLKKPCARVTGDIRMYHGHYILHDGVWYAYYLKSIHHTGHELRLWLQEQYEIHVAKSILL